MSRSLALHQIRPMRRARAALRAVAAAVLVVALAACGGGGGGGNSGSSGQVGALAQALGADPNAVAAALVAGSTAFEQTVFPLMRANCETCHGGSGPGFPHIAHPDLDTAYRAVVDTQKVDLFQPVNSRLVLRMDPEGHNCWSPDCADDAETLRAAIAQWALLVGAGVASGTTGGTTGGTGGVPAIPTIPVDAIASETLALSGAAQGQAGGRVEANVIALWNFRSGSGNTALDTSGIDPAIDLTLTGTEWLSGGGIENTGGKAQAPADTSRKLFDRIADQATGSQVYSIEAWVLPANTDQEGPARIVSYSEGTGVRNFTLGQENYNYVFRNRSSAEVGANGTPALETADADEDLQAVLQHVVSTFDDTNGRRIYVNGVDTGDVDAAGPGLLTNWNPEYRFVLGNETTDNRLWLGQIRMVAIHDAALTPAQVMQNYQAGVGEKFALRFALDAYLGAGSYIEFEVSEFDNFSYLFCFPTVVTTNPNGLPLEGIRIAVNGVMPAMSQSFAQTSAQLTQASQQISDLCSVVPKDRGPSLDQFTILFELLGGFENRIVEAAPVIAANNEVAAPSPDVGIRDFAQVNDTMATLTGVDPLSGDVSRAFDDLTQQLPGTTDILSFVSSQQVAIFKLALEYCDALVDSSSRRQAFFGPDFEFGQPVPTAFSSQVKRDMIIGALVDNMVGTGLASQPTRAELQPVLDGLLDQLVAGCDAATCPAATTRTVVKGMCAAVLSSAAVHVQ